MDNRFNMHGGYFSPTGYFEVETGGSHEENPNGGVQVGVDPQGIPNVLEEGEPVYDDYVYSDNISADLDVLKAHNIPAKYAGKLYSEIADAFVDEAEDRPLDPVSNNGLRVMLGRLADAQEEQKQIEEQKQLEEELSQLSPEELNELEQMLAAQEQEQAMSEEQMVAPEQQMMPQEMPVEQPMGQPMPVMTFGGPLLRRFDMGGPKRTIPVGGGSRATSEELVAPSLLEYALGPDNAIVRGVNTARDFMDNTAAGRIISAVIPDDATQALSLPMVPSGITDVNILGQIKSYEDRFRKGEKMLADAKAQGIARDVAKKMREDGNSLMRESADYIKKLIKQSGVKPERASSGIGKKIIKAITPSKRAAKIGLGVGLGTAAAGGAGYGIYKAIDNDKPLMYVEDEYDIVPSADFARGGLMNRFDDGGYAEKWNNFLSSLNDYRVSRAKGNRAGTYVIDRRFPLAGFKNIKALEDSDAYKAFTDYVIANPNDRYVQSYLHSLDDGTAPGVAKLFNGDVLSKGWADLYRSRRYDQKGGIYHFSGPDAAALSGLTSSAGAGVGRIDSTPIGQMPGMGASTTGRGYTVDTGTITGNRPASGLIERGTASRVMNEWAKRPARPDALPTWPRYAGAVTNGILGLYNAFMEPDRYHIRHYTPVLPDGQLDLIDPEFNPIDENLAVNDVLANGAGTVRALANSGIGPSLGATLLAADYNTGRALGDARLKVWDANNQRRNDIIARRNANGQAIGTFDYGISRDRAQILNAAKERNIGNELMQQRLNYAGEAEKYAALQSNIDAVSHALSGIGQENFAMNQINSSPYFDYVVLPDGRTAYVPKTNTAKRGGTLLIRYKK